MRIIKIFFSPTGGTKRVIYMLSEALPGEDVQVDLTDIRGNIPTIRINQDDRTLIAMPEYGGRAPVLAMERFRKLNGSGSKCLLVAVYGNRAYEDTLVEMQDTDEECGFHVTGAIAAVAEHSVVRQFAAGRPDEKDWTDIHRAAQNWLTVLHGNSSISEIPGNQPYTKPMSLSLVPNLTKSCIKCGKCKDSCPSGAICAEFSADKRKCISCMRCVTVCPAGSRILGRIMVRLSAAVLKKGCSKRKNLEVYLY